MLDKLGLWAKESLEGTVDMSRVYEWLTFDIIGKAGLTTLSCTEYLSQSVY